MCKIFLFFHQVSFLFFLCPLTFQLLIVPSSSGNLFIFYFPIASFRCVVHFDSEIIKKFKVNITDTIISKKELIRLELLKIFYSRVVRVHICFFDYSLSVLCWHSSLNQSNKNKTFVKIIKRPILSYQFYFIVSFNSKV